MLRTTPISLGHVINARRKYLTYRLVAILAVDVCYAPLIGMPIMALITALYVSVQLIEVRCFSGEKPWLSIHSRLHRGIALSIIALTAVLFGFPSLILSYRWGNAGATSAAYLLCCALLSGVVSTIGCRAAFKASVLPTFFYAYMLQVNALLRSNAPSLWVSFGFFSAGILLTANVWVLWLRSSRSQAGELRAVRRYIAQRDFNEQRLLRVAERDSLTGLPNRDVLYTRLAEMIQVQHAGTLMMIDLDGFKYVNDTLGHSAGDTVLRDIAERIRLASRGYTSARLGGDEFALLIPGIADSAEAVAIATAMIGEVSRPVTLDGQQINIGASIGIAIYPMQGNDPELLFANADLALYQAKAEGRHCARLYYPELRALAEGKVRRDTELCQALERGEFEMFYQPQLRLSDGTLAGAEALLRWRHPERGILVPLEFLAALEGGLLSARVGAWVIETACRQAAEWRAQGAPNFRIGVNVFGAQFRSGNLVEWVIQACATAGLPPEALEIEITENIILRHEDEIIAPLRELRARGVGVAFDDYGTGFASLSMLTRFPVSRLKIDRSFTNAICERPTEAAIIRTVIGLARALDLQVTAEGIETLGQAEALTREQCDEGQGYFFGKPMSAADFARCFGLGPHYAQPPLIRAS